MTSSRKTLATYGAKGATVRVFIERGGLLVRAQWRERGRLMTKSWPNTADAKAGAKAWAKAFATSRDQPQPVATARATTLREMWEAYSMAEFPHLRPKTIRNYTDRWADWERFVGRHFLAEHTTLEMIDQYRAMRTKLGRSVAQTGEHIKVVKQVYAWAQRRELLARNRVALYRFRVAKEDRTTAPAEYQPDDFPKLVAQLDPKNGREWRAYVATVLCGTQGARINAVLHLRWDDVDFDAGTIRWAPTWDKMGHDRTQPLTRMATEALYVALGWSRRDPAHSGWVFYTPTASKLAKGDPTYGIQAYWRMLKLAERAAGITPQPRRAAHGLRRMAAGNALEASGNVADAMFWIGDTDLRQAKKYVKERDARMQTIAAHSIMGGEAAGNQFSTTVTEPQSGPETPTASESPDAANTVATTTYDNRP